MHLEDRRRSLGTFRRLLLTEPTNNCQLEGMRGNLVQIHQFHSLTGEDGTEAGFGQGLRHVLALAAVMIAGSGSRNVLGLAGAGIFTPK